MGSTPVDVQCPLTFSLGEFPLHRLLGLALVSWAFARVGVHRLSLRLPYFGVFPFTLLHLPLNFIRVSSLRFMYLHPPVDPSHIYFGECPGLGLALVTDFVVPEAQTLCGLLLSEGKTWMNVSPS